MQNTERQKSHKAAVVKMGWKPKPIYLLFLSAFALLQITIYNIHKNYRIEIVPRYSSYQDVQKALFLQEGPEKGPNRNNLALESGNDVNGDDNEQEMNKATISNKRKSSKRIGKNSTTKTGNNMANRFVRHISNSTFVRHDSTHDDNNIPVKTFTPWRWKEKGHPCFQGHDNRRKSKSTPAKKHDTKFDTYRRPRPQRSNIRENTKSILYNTSFHKHAHSS